MEEREGGTGIGGRPAFGKRVTATTLFVVA